MTRSGLCWLLSIGLLTACVTESRGTRDCASITDKNFRDQCLAETIQDAQRETGDVETTGTEIAPAIEQGSDVDPVTPSE